MQSGSRLGGPAEEGEAGGSAEPGGATLSGYAVGIVNYRTYEDLERCLSALRGQTHAPLAVVVVDADSEATRLDCLRLRYPEVSWQPAPNRGYAGGANRALMELERLAPSADFVLLLNPDVQLEDAFAERLLEVVDAYPDVALFSGKLLRPDGRTLDSAGIDLPLHRRPRDRGSDELDRGQYDRVEEVFAVSGAAMLIRRTALVDLPLECELFDEDFFVYHEDTDLAWRARRIGWRVLYVPSARALHARRWRRDRRFRMAVSTRRHSFKNHYLELVKNEPASRLLLHLPVLAAWELARLGYALVRDREMLGAYRQAWALLPSAWRKRRLLAERVREGEAARRRPAAGSRP